MKSYKHTQDLQNPECLLHSDVRQMEDLILEPPAPVDIRTSMGVGAPSSQTLCVPMGFEGIF